MKKRKKKNAITLLALVITIVIMLLLAGVAIQMTMGENGLIAKSIQAQKEQAKAELYDTAKLSYMSLNAKALENGQPSPQAELALSTTEFTNKYNVVGDDITDKKGTTIDTKANVLNIIQGTVAGGFTPGTTTSVESWPKTVAGVTIPEEDKEKMILKLKVLGNKEKIKFGGYNELNIDYGNGDSDQELNLYQGKKVEYNRGEYIIKISGFGGFRIEPELIENVEFEILQWGKLSESYDENNEVVVLPSVTKIYEPEPDKVVVSYHAGKMTEIPEWLFSKKITSKKMSYFIDCEKITSIPENLFRNCINVEEFEFTFNGTRITSIPEKLFKYNTRVKKWEVTFRGCTELTSIPENLFKHNVESEQFNSTFEGCTGLTSIPENLFKYNTNIKEQENAGFSGTFWGCTGLISIPENLFKYNTEVRKIQYVFNNCTGLTNIPENIFKYNTEVTNFSGIFGKCTGLTNIPESLFKYNTKVWSFDSIFEKCTGLLSIPENLFEHNINANSFGRAFEGCSSISYIPEKIIERVGNNTGVFKGCTSASNYSSIPEYMK